MRKAINGGLLGPLLSSFSSSFIVSLRAPSATYSSSSPFPQRVRLIRAADNLKMFSIHFFVASVIVLAGFVNAESHTIKFTVGPYLFLDFETRLIVLSHRTTAASMSSQSFAPTALMVCGDKITFFDASSLISKI